MLVDVGCGDGFGMFFLVVSGYKVIGFDLLEEMI